jgi:serine/threonine protein kinase
MIGSYSYICKPYGADSTKVYQIYRPSDDFITKHPLCKNHNYVFLKINNTTDFNHEYNINCLFYKMFEGNNICQCLGFGKNYIIYEHIKHSTLDRLLYDYTKKKLSFTKLKNASNHLFEYIVIFKKIKSLIHIVHRHGFTFNDMHLNNILITGNNNFYLTDFECVKKSTNKRERKNDLKCVNHALFFLYIYWIIFKIRKTIILALRLILPNRFL